MTAALLHAWLRRLAAVPDKDAWIVRGGLVTCHACPARPPPEDVDLLGEGDFDATRVARFVERVSATARDDGVTFDGAAARHEVIWGESPFPGLRSHVPARIANGELGELGVRIDVGFGDPLDPPPRVVVLGGAEVRAVTVETMIAWKVHGLVEHGRGRWRAKDIADVVLLTEVAGIDQDGLLRALRLAFDSRGTSLGELTPLLEEPSWGLSRSSRRKWETFMRRRPCPVPSDVVTARDIVRAQIAPLVARLRDLETANLA